jgi:CHAD domain-containing protein
MHNRGWSIIEEAGMMTVIKEPDPLKAECIFGVQRLLPLLDAFSKEIDGVRTAQDIEHIHRMRVASRRLRAALPLFASCFPEKKYQQWMEEIQKVTRALGEARDTDVQIAFLTKLIKKRQARIHTDAPGMALSIHLNADVETILLSGLQKKRIKLQTVVVSSLEKLENSGIIDDMRVFFHDQEIRAKSTRKKPSPYGIVPVAASRIAIRLNKLLSYEVWVHNPDAIAEHHAIRIAAKKLRYTIEVYSPLYRRGLKKPLSRVKKIQEILGDLHDCDVWIDQVMVMLVKERLTSQATTGRKNMRVSKVTRYKHFLAEREKERKILYQRFVRFWDSLRRSRLWDELRKNLDAERKRTYRFSGSYQDNDIRLAVSNLAALDGEGLVHSRKVTDLALRIFDDLEPLHRMGARERFLLECAGLLHDIGWKFGQKGHSGRSADMILSHENLPLDVIDRGIIGLVAKAHRGKIRFESEGFFSLLSSDDRNNVLMLAALLRVADGLDYLHFGSAESVHCTINPQEIILEISAQRDISAEKEHALQKSELFNRVFERKLVIS